MKRFATLAPRASFINMICKVKKRRANEGFRLKPFKKRRTPLSLALHRDDIYILNTKHRLEIDEAKIHILLNSSSHFLLRNSSFASFIDKPVFSYVSGVYNQRKRILRKFTGTENLNEVSTQKWVMMQGIVSSK